MSGPILLSGASGLVGSALAQSLESEGKTTLRLVRRPPATPLEVEWSPAASQPFSDPGRLEGISAAVHLSGASVAGRRWTKAYKREIEESRIGTTRILAETLARLKEKPAVFVCASASGFYGDGGEAILTEQSPKGEGYLADLCQAWEQATLPAQEAGIRVVHLRLGVVLARQGGMLARLLPVFRLGLGGKLASGQQWLSWITLSDLLRVISFVMEKEAMAGAINAVAPQPVRNAEFTRALAGELHRPAFFAVPALALTTLFGEMAQEALLASTRALPERLLAAGFSFEHNDIQQGLRAALR